MSALGIAQRPVRLQRRGEGKNEGGKPVRCSELDLAVPYVVKK